MGTQTQQASHFILLRLVSSGKMIQPMIFVFRNHRMTDQGMKCICCRLEHNVSRCCRGQRSDGSVPGRVSRHL